MKPFRTIFISVLCLGLLFSTISCAVILQKDNGKHKGWYKNTNNPHNPNSKNPGKSHGKPGK